MGKRASWYALTAWLMLWVSGSAGAQLSQYTAAGELADIQKGRKESLEKAVEQARYHLGSVRIDPWIALREIAYVDDGRRDDQGRSLGGDYTASAGAGLRAYLPIRGRTYLVAHTLPEYIWWKDRPDQKELAGRYGAGLFGFYRRLGLEVTGTRVESQAPVTPENEQRVSGTTDAYSAAVDLLLGHSIYLTASAGESRARFDAGTAANADRFADLDRDEQVQRGGVRFQFAHGLALGVGVERSRVDFQPGTRDRSNSGSSGFLTVGYSGSRHALSIDVVKRELEADEGSQFVPYSDTTGRVQLSLGVSGRINPSFYASRNLVYTVAAGSPYFNHDVYGTTFALKLGSRTSVAVTAEAGSDDYTAALPGTPQRQDDFTSFAVQLNRTVGRYADLKLGGYRTRYTSNVAGSDRDYSGVRFGLTFGAGKGSWY